MKKLCAFLAVFLLSLAPLTAEIIRVQTVISRYVEADKTELIGARIITVLSTPASATFKNLTITLLATEADDKSIRISTRLAEKLPDGTTTRHEAETLTIPLGQTTPIRLGDYKLELTPSIAERPGFTINFPGGTLAQFLAQLPQNRSSMVFNLIGENADLQTELPPLNLKIASTGTLALALNNILNPKGLAIGLSKSGVTDFSGRDTVYILQKVSEPDSNQSPSAPRFRSYDLSDYLDEKVTIDHITQALRSAWELQPDNKPEALRIKYHPATSLLLVNGPASAIKTVETTLGSLRPKNQNTATLSIQQMETVAEEIRRRRELRQAVTAPLNPDSDTQTPLENSQKPPKQTETDRAKLTAKVRHDIEALRAASAQKIITVTPPSTPLQQPPTK